MHSAFWLLVAIVALVVGYGFICAYRLARETIADTIFLMVLTAAAMGAAYLFG
jgi:hypothetical protein